jgi:hypothetical protein
MNMRIVTSLTTVFIVNIDSDIDWLNKKTKTHVSHWSVNDHIIEPIVHRWLSYL